MAADTPPDRTLTEPLAAHASVPGGGSRKHSPAIQTDQLVKTYGRGRMAKTALTGLNLTVERGEVFGFLGPNGAGKTTTIRLLLDLLRPTSGQIRVLGSNPRDAVGLRNQLGYLAGDFVVGGRRMKACTTPSFCRLPFERLPMRRVRSRSSNSASSVIRSAGTPPRSRPR